MGKTSRRPGPRPEKERGRVHEARAPRELGRDAPIGLGLALGFLLLYVRTLCPTVYLGDSGEICTAIATGGILHPPGYPLFSLLGRAALVLVPYGEPAFRIGCVAALAAAGGVAALYALARSLGCSRSAAAAGAATFGATSTYWSQSVRVEVYSLHIVLVCLALTGALQYRRSGRTTHLAASALAGSLGLAHHLTIVLLIPGLVALCGRRLWSAPGRGRRLGTVAALLPAGPALYALLPVWAGSDALQTWGRPVTLPLLWGHVTARIYQGKLGVPDAGALSQGVAQAAGLLAENYPSLLFLLPLLGAWALGRRDCGSAVGLLLAALAVTAYNLCYRIEDIAGYYLPVWLVAAALLAVSLDAIRQRLPHPGLVAAAFWLLPGLLLTRNAAVCDLSRSTWVRAFARHKLESADPRGVLVSQADDDTFPLWYLHDVLHVRPDLTLIDRALAGAAWLDYERDPSLWYLSRLRREGISVSLDVPPDPAERRELGRDRFLIRLLEGPLRGRPLCMTFTVSSAPEEERGRLLVPWTRARYRMLPQGLVVHLEPRETPVDLAALLRQNERLWARIDLPDLRRVRDDQEGDPGWVVNHYAATLVNFGGLYEMAGDLRRAEAVYRRAAAWAPRYAPGAAALAAVRRNGRGASAVRPGSSGR